MTWTILDGGPRVELIRNCSFLYFSESASTWFLLVPTGNKTMKFCFRNQFLESFREMEIVFVPTLIVGTDKARDIDDELPGHFCLMKFVF